jgi:suppressor of ftsI
MPKHQLFTPRKFITRRQFMMAGGALVGMAMLGGGHTPLDAAEREANTDRYTLTLGYSERKFGEVRLRTRTYNGSLPGPLIVTRPGRNLRIAVVNGLPPNPPATPPPGIDPENNPYDFNTTNLHLHGMQVIPHLFAPLGTSNPASRMIAINPGERLTYDFRLPGDHPCGLYWYHPHHHGSATVQVGGGMAGLILVKGPIDEVPEIAAARDELLAIQNPKVNPLADGKWGWEPIAYKSPAKGGFSFTTALEFITVNGEPVMLIDRRGRKPATIAGKLKTFRMKPGEVMRLRILNGTDGIPMQLVLPGFEVYVIAQDGVNLLKPERAAEDAKTAIRMAPGNRIELLIRAPRHPASAALSALPQRVSSPALLSEAMGEMMAMPELELANFVVAGAPRRMEIPQVLPPPRREYPLIADGEIVARRRVEFAMQTGSKRILTGIEFTLGGKLYQETRVDTVVKLGTAEEWTLANKSDGIHPFHMHVNSFEVIGTPWDPNYHRLHDTIWLPPFSETKMRVRFKQWQGKSVYHCHILAHEDTAMIANFLIE